MCTSECIIRIRVSERHGISRLRPRNIGFATRRARRVRVTATGNRRYYLISPVKNARKKGRPLPAMTTPPASSSHADPAENCSPHRPTISSTWVMQLRRCSGRVGSHRGRKEADRVYSSSLCDWNYTGCLCTSRCIKISAVVRSRVHVRPRSSENCEELQRKWRSRRQSRIATSARAICGLFFVELYYRLSRE